MLEEFIRDHRAELIRRAREKVAVRRAPIATEAELSDGIPLFLEQLVTTLKLSSTDHPFPVQEIGDGAARHGRRLLGLGFTVAQVVHDYGDLCQAITELANDKGADISAGEFRTFNAALDNAIASAVTEYSRWRDDSATHLEAERLGVLSHELRNQLSTITLCFGMLRQGKVGISGSTGAVIERSLRSMSRLIDRSLAEVRLDAGIATNVQVWVAELIEDIEVWALTEARARGLALAIAPVPAAAFVKGDRQLLSAALQNLLQNAFKFTRPGGTVRLTTGVSEGRVLVAVQDECGGLPAGAVGSLLDPFTQKSIDRSGLGLGLTIVTKTLAAMEGSLRVKDLPGKGCIFTIDLPEHAAEERPAEH
ncbi:MAG: HAMP domain-containing histidine kinase [Archangiaceae bacterium]|nr:HAMP domain-containing histidine kinase [Archangiaceae bacterium]